MSEIIIHCGRYALYVGLPLPSVLMSFRTVGLSINRFPIAFFFVIWPARPSGTAATPASGTSGPHSDYPVLRVGRRHLQSRRWSKRGNQYRLCLPTNLYGRYLRWFGLVRLNFRHVSSTSCSCSSSVNVYYRINHEPPDPHTRNTPTDIERTRQEREFKIGSIGFSDSTGILLASLLAVPTEIGLCKAQVRRGKMLCKSL